MLLSLDIGDLHTPFDLLLYPFNTVVSYTPPFLFHHSHSKQLFFRRPVGRIV